MVKPVIHLGSTETEATRTARTEIRHLLVFFKNGKRMAVNGRDTIYGSDTACWKEAIEKLGKEFEEQRALTSTPFSFYCPLFLLFSSSLLIPA